MANADRNYRLLIIDDDETDRRFYDKLLSGQPHGVCEIRQAADGAAGLAALRAQLPDCVLLDFSLPDLTGLELLANAAVDGVLPCAVVLITGAGSEAIAVAAMQHGVQDYLVKDQVNVRNLWSAIANAVAQAELRQRPDGTVRAYTAANAALEHEIAVRQAAEADLRRAKQAAERADAAKTRFVATVTHELRAPLDGILGYAELLRIEGQLSPAQETRVAAILQAGHHMREMIETVLDAAATDSGQIVLHPSPVEIRELTESCIGSIGPMATERGLGLRLVSAHDAPRQITTDPARLRQVLLNLLGNAVKYTEAGSAELRVLAGAKPGGLRIEIADTGPGIDAANRNRLFREFGRLDANAATEGAGLGLGIAARLVNRMGGTIGHAPNAGGGSIFWLELPPGELASSAPHFQGSPAASSWSPPPSLSPLLSPSLSASPSPGRRVLLVDDNAMNHDVISACEPPAEPRLDRIALDATLTFLPPDEVTANLQVLREFQAQMLQLLDQPTEPALLTQAAHSLASNAGMFGFAALCTVARNFEHAIAGDAPEADRLGQLMRTEIGVGLTTLDALEHERRIQPALARAA